MANNLSALLIYTFMLKHIPTPAKYLRGKQREGLKALRKSQKNYLKLKMHVFPGIISF